jgi:ribosomal protein S18 acetylase RimI-like enzyme
MLQVEKTPLAHLVEDDLETMMHAHWRECSKDHDAVPFDPDWLVAYTMERCGTLHCFGLYSDGGLVGYAIFQVSAHLHFKSTRYAFNSGLYVKPECRRGNAGSKLLVESERLLGRMGIKKITYSVPDTSALGPVLKKGGYVPSETYYTKLVN